MSLDTIFKVSEVELSRIVKSPIVFAVVIVLVLLAIIHVMGLYTYLAEDSSLNWPFTTIFFRFLNGFFFILSVILAFLSLCVGSLSVIDDRAKGTMRVLLTKPLYRRDIIFGKYVGVMSFLLVMVVFSVTLFVSLMLIFGGVPANFPDLLLRLCAYVFLFYLNSAFTVSVVMLFGIVFKDKLVALVVSASYVFIEWASPAPIIPDSFGDLRLINPSYIYQVTLLNPGNTGIKLFDSFDYTSSTLVSWLGASWLYLILMMAEVVIVILVCCMIYIREEG